jgi:hypothetical protein
VYYRPIFSAENAVIQALEHMTDLEFAATRSVCETNPVFKLAFIGVHLRTNIN